MSDPSQALAPEEVRRILERRAAALSRPQRAEDLKERRELLILQIGTERYGIDVGQIAEVRPLGALTPIPGLPDIWAGVVNLRGVLRPILDGATYLGVERGGTGTGQVVFIREGDLVVGLLADEVAGLRKVAIDDIEPPLAIEADAHRKAVVGITADLLLLLDAKAILEDETLEVDQQQVS